MDKEGVKIDVVLGTALVGMYSKCGSLDNALKVFQGMAERDVTAWSTMIAGYAIHGHGEKALQLFDAMKRSKTIPIVSLSLVFYPHAATPDWLKRSSNFRDHVD
ncbi:Pentatricopeptide repeat-containing protein, mitochondrial [Vitis vinifera]|uniref:Pentatricopeptide repeat-containing protein, mitochondrial n=1 Tax=Vitis vinifera TaxID=29760 RepID=A0A438FES4_VITVI|nr:Pentatricopeptide repeat-containing protein, mitochondrial [Vitis vinifera]